MPITELCLKCPLSAPFSFSLSVPNLRQKEALILMLKLPLGDHSSSMRFLSVPASTFCEYNGIWSFGYFLWIRSIYAPILGLSLSVQQTPTLIQTPKFKVKKRPPSILSLDAYRIELMMEKSDEPDLGEPTPLPNERKVK